ncbi:MAG: FAD-binding protein [Actinomycetota bacterium]|nr:FAD-binding protein [Actinomycetota bacterium]
MLDELVSRLGDDVVVRDPDVVEGYRRDRCDLVDAGTPLAVVRARSTADVSATLQWASTHDVPVVPRGAGTGLSGGAHAITGGVVLSLERMTSVREIDPEARMAVVEAGVITADVDRAAAAHGLFYPPDPGSFEISTIGGNLATNAGGMRCVKYGVTRDAVLGLEVVLADGRVLRTGGRTIKNVAGLDLTSLLIGSEGTLGVITAATLRLRRAPATPPTTFVATFSQLAAVGRAVAAIVASGAVPSLLELMDRETINAVEDHRRMDLDREAAGLLIGQADGPDADAQVAVMSDCAEAAGADLVLVTADPVESDALLMARRLAGYATMEQGPSVIEDVGVPPHRLVELLSAIQEAGDAFGIRIATVGHAGDGNLHPILMLPDLHEDTRARALAAADRISRAAVTLGGTITGEHGVGQLKRRWLAEQHDPLTAEVSTAIKSALDPTGILNPGRGF